jgi:DNA-binding transcriptional regulator GbsR (MarR family)
VTTLLRELLARDADASCATALVMYFARHPHIYVTIDRLAVQVGYSAARVESSIEMLIRAGVIVQRRHAGLTAVMYRVSAPPWPQGLPATAFMSRWQRQIRLLRDARERCRRAALRAARADERLRRAAELIASLPIKTSFPRDG